ncbi:MAG TPA: TIGR04282 family arsenosugar biosynthesis glycosyltransferase [Ktedonobacterales bacterium]|nr:TIGR04282 family arsenosugar biosynthesis glycosyltransferase [Ktedonobacterales bacterium]
MRDEDDPRRGRDETLAIVMPALNEDAAVGRQVRALREHPALAVLPAARLIVVDNGSTDRTAAVAWDAGAQVVREPRRGYGYACLAGVRAAGGADVVLLMDADGSDDPAAAARLAQAVLRGEADLVVGSRVRGRREPGALTLQQRAGNAVGAAVLRLLYGLRVSDIGPLRAIRREALLALDMREMAYGWSTEMLAKAARAGLRVAEMPVDYHRRAGGKSKVAGTLRGTLGASWHILRTLWRYRRWNPSFAQSAPDTLLPPDANRHPPRSALLMVARVPSAGQTKTRLGAVIGHEQAATLYGAFLADLGARFSEAAARDSYDLYWYYAAPAGADERDSERDFARWVPPAARLLRQEGADLGERLWNGFQALHARGYERIVVLGSDSPQIPAARVREAFDALTTHDAVIGPARDGGYYLLGQRGAPADLFTGIQMSTPTVCAETVARASGLGRRVARLAESFDVDVPADLETLLAALDAAPSSEADPAPATRSALGALLPATTEVSVFEAEGAAHGA